ncbi:TonB-dependent receptor [Flavobacterium sp. MAH-1]|uniref:TonB-dependent receptor n=1 Tax=Flavobacterium agri TaxID=2743471 RepID=A0A7Y9C6T9_9FLAO|nr:TonB-dependent receptor [Flavobacterium agri]NUY80719.1 TonB-dependent receptor [Flavobacterium agri]NYA70743.1 TonB-dependent receptor [Flavobacterium agri]
MKFKKVLFFCISALLFSFIGYAQNITVSGKVTDETGLPVPGTTVTVKGTQTASLTDIDGNYQISAPSNGTLVYSFIGYKTLELAIAGQTTVNAKMTSSSEALDEVVVVGYGTQKKSVVTGAISQVKGKDLEGQPVTRIEQTLQGRTSGVYVAANAGQPGSAATVRIRGITTTNDSNPLYVVDGIIVDASGVQYINQYDIESIEVLKDASGSVYGTRAGNGVILITTKKGKSGKITVSYNGFAGFSEESRRVGLLNATQYATLMNERSVNDGNGIRYDNPSSFGRGTDWQDVIFQNASRESHDVSISGGTENSRFYASFSLLDQEGIVLPSISRYQRKTIRLNSDHKIGKYVTVGQTAAYSNEKNLGVGNTNSEFGGALSSALNLDPLTPLIVTDPTVINDPQQPYSTQNGIFTNAQGFPYGISPLVTNEMSNPLAYEASRQGGYGFADNFTGNAFVEIAPIEGLKWRTSAVGKLAYYGNQSFTPEYYFNNGPPGNNDTNRLSRTNASNFSWNVENTITYSKTIQDHNFNILLGQGAYVQEGETGQTTTYFGLPVDTWQEASFNFNLPDAQKTTNAYRAADNKVSSLFARLTYDYKGRYLLQGFVRRDGSTQFGANKKYGNFPALSLGWVPSKESFWPENNIVTQLKFRASWGVTGNDRIGSFGYASLISGGFNYTFGPTGAPIIVTGSTITRPPNPDLEWEETTKKNIAADITLFRDLTLTVDLWRNKTTGILKPFPIPGYVGLDQPLANLGEVINNGIDFELGYRKKLGDFTLGFNGNISFFKNEVTALSPNIEFETTAGVQSLEGGVQRNQVGHSVGAFYGFHHLGIFQNQAQIDSYVGASGSPIQPDARPGDFIWEDVNGDGSISDDDRKFIGKSLPDYTYGFTVSLEYKNFDLNFMAQGAAGNQIFNALRRLELQDANFQTNALNRWTGEGTSNTYPRLTADDPNKNYSRPSNFYLENGDYLRLKTTQIGYSLPKDVIGQAGLSRVRIYLMGENLVTFTKYTGYDPEIGNGNNPGIDRGYYPQARSYMLGVNLQF